MFMLNALVVDYRPIIRAKIVQGLKEADRAVRLSKIFEADSADTALGLLLDNANDIFCVLIHLPMVKSATDLAKYSDLVAKHQQAVGKLYDLEDRGFTEDSNEWLSVRFQIEEYQSHMQKLCSDLKCVDFINACRQEIGEGFNDKYIELVTGCERSLFSTYEIIDSQLVTAIEEWSLPHLKKEMESRFFHYRTETWDFDWLVRSWAKTYLQELALKL